MCAHFCSYQSAISILRIWMHQRIFSFIRVRVSLSCSYTLFLHLWLISHSGILLSLSTSLCMLFHTDLPQVSLCVPYQTRHPSAWMYHLTARLYEVIRQTHSRLTYRASFAGDKQKGEGEEGWIGNAWTRLLRGLAASDWTTTTTCLTD